MEQTFKGTGWSFPPTFDKNAGGVEMVSGNEDIQQSLQILLSTALTERVMQPAYGCNLQTMLFESMNTTTQTFIKDLVETAILYHEPRIKLKEIKMDTTNLVEGLINIDIHYAIKSTNSRFNMVYPFYFKEGTEVINK